MQQKGLFCCVRFSGCFHGRERWVRCNAAPCPPGAYTSDHKRELENRFPRSLDITQFGQPLPEPAELGFGGVCPESLGFSAGLGRQTSFPLLLLAQQPVSRNRIPEAKLAIYPPDVQVQRLAARPYPAAALMAQLESMILPINQVLAHYSVILEFNVPSYRTDAAQNRRIEEEADR